MGGWCCHCEWRLKDSGYREKGWGHGGSELRVRLPLVMFLVLRELIVNGRAAAVRYEGSPIDKSTSSREKCAQ